MLRRPAQRLAALTGALVLVTGCPTDGQDDVLTVQDGAPKATS